MIVAASTGRPQASYELQTNTGYRRLYTGGVVQRRSTYSHNIAAHKWVYLFREGSGEMRDLLGGK